MQDLIYHAVRRVLIRRRLPLQFFLQSLLFFPDVGKLFFQLPAGQQVVGIQIQIALTLLFQTPQPGAHFFDVGRMIPGSVGAAQFPAQNLLHPMPVA